MSFYVDDSKTSRVINSPDDHSVFQSDLDNLYPWGRQNIMEYR